MPSKVLIQTEITDEPNRRPYAARVDFLLGEDVKLSLDGEVCLLAASNVVIELKLLRSPGRLMGDFKHLELYRATISGFARASEAETNGLRLSMALLWVAISRKFTLRLHYHTPLPCVVYDRTQNMNGIAMFIETSWSIHQPANPNDLAKQMEEVFSKTDLVDPQLLLSMELFAAAGLEVTERTRFIGLVSALEPLAIPSDYPESVGKVIDEFCKQLRGVEISEFFEQGDQQLQASEKIKNSLVGRLRELKHESIRQALLRTVRELLSDEDATKVVDSAYSLRSKILHEGTNDPYLDRKSNEIENVIRRMYEKRMGYALHTPARN